jgi:hypothetical protein
VRQRRTETLRHCAALQDLTLGQTLQCCVVVLLFICCLSERDSETQRQTGRATLCGTAGSPLGQTLQCCEYTAHVCGTVSRICTVHFM